MGRQQFSQSSMYSCCDTDGSTKTETEEVQNGQIKGCSIITRKITNRRENGSYRYAKQGFAKYLLTSNRTFFPDVYIETIQA